MSGSFGMQNIIIVICVPQVFLVRVLEDPYVFVVTYECT